MFPSPTWQPCLIHPYRYRRSGKFGRCADRKSPLSVPSMAQPFLLRVTPGPPPDRAFFLSCCTLTYPIPGKSANVLIVCHANNRSEEHTSELQSLMRISYAVFCL